MDDSKEQLAEQVLVLRCQSGDEFAFTRMMRVYDSRLRYYVRRLMASRAEADDLMQEIWLAVWRQVPTLRQPEAFRTWLYRIARNMALKTIRYQTDVQTLDGNDIADESHVFTAEDAEVVHAALDKLPVFHRDVLVLKFIENMTYEEIADTVGCAVGTVRSRMHYAKKALRVEMEKMP